MWVYRVAEQMVQVCKQDEEIDNPRSYAMYMPDVRLTGKSPYSAYSAHYRGLSRIPHCKNARVVGTPQLTGIIPNSIVPAYALARFRKYKMQFSVTESLSFNPNRRNLKNVLDR